MPGKEEILQRVRELEPSYPEHGEEPEQIYQGRQYSAGFRLTKNEPLWVLTVSGTKRGRERLVADFTAALGPPSHQMSFLRLKTLQYSTWNVADIPQVE